MKEFNYCVAHYWEEGEGSIGAYNIFGEVHHGTMKEAKNALKYVKKKNPDEEWKIFMVVELPT